MKNILCYFSMATQRWYMFTGNLLTPATFKVEEAKAMENDELLLTVELLGVRKGHYYQIQEGVKQWETGIY